VVLEDGVYVGRVAGETGVGRYVLACVVAFRWAIPEEDAAVKCFSIVRNVVGSLEGSFYGLELDPCRNWLLYISTLEVRRVISVGARERCTFTHSLKSGWRSPKDAWTAPVSRITAAMAVIRHLDELRCLIVVAWRCGHDRGQESSFQGCAASGTRLGDSTRLSINLQPRLLSAFISHVLHDQVSFHSTYSKL
jgi:hypothetical protein